MHLLLSCGRFQCRLKAREHGEKDPGVDLDYLRVGQAGNRHDQAEGKYRKARKMFDVSPSGPDELN